MKRKTIDELHYSIGRYFATDDNGAISVEWALVAMLGKLVKVVQDASRLSEIASRVMIAANREHLTALDKMILQSVEKDAAEDREIERQFDFVDAKLDALKCERGTIPSTVRSKLFWHFSDNINAELPETIGKPGTKVEAAYQEWKSRPVKAIKEEPPHAEA